VAPVIPEATKKPAEVIHMDDQCPTPSPMIEAYENSKWPQSDME